MYILLGFRYILRSGDYYEKTGNDTLAGLDLNPIASPAFRIGYSANPRKMHLTNATNYPGRTRVPKPRHIRVSLD
jgi:hypothetical protein